MNATTSVCETTDGKIIVDDSKNVSFEIKPDPLNLKCKGVLPAVIVGTETFDVTAIDPDSLKLTREGIEDGVVPIRYGFSDAEIKDMLLKFRVPEVVEVLMLDEVAGQTIPLVGTGVTTDGTLIRGQDTVRLLGNTVKECVSDCDCDADVDGSDAAIFKEEFGRRNCSRSNPCVADFYVDGDVDGLDALTFKSEFGTIFRQ